jgi:membrane fusion protein, copper/silver efflux system
MRTLAFAIVGGGALAAAAYAGYWYAQRGMTQGEPAVASAGVTQDSKVLYWYDPMYPQQKFDKPGKSPFMDMQLVPKYAGDEADPGTVSISPRVVQNLGVRVAEAKSAAIEQRFEAVGAVAYNERNVVQLQSRAMGFVETLHARAPLDPVKKGAPLVDILYPDWAGAQEEFLLLRKSLSGDLAQAARQRLVLLGMNAEQIAAVERDGKVRNRFTLTSPISGVIAELGVREGMSVTSGMTLFRLVDLSTVWLNAEVPEAQAARVRPGTPVKAQVAGYPGEVFEGRVGAILPEVNAATRTLRARVELANPRARLVPGMYATVEFAAPGRKEAVLVPSEAVIRTGTRDVVIVALGEGKFRAAEVQVGTESGGQSEIRKGLSAGDRVVLSGQFLIDSEASLSSTVARLEVSDEATKPQAQAAHAGRGTVKALDVEAGRVEVDHEPIASMQWPAMTMGFMVEDKAQLAKIKKGDAVQFELRGQPDQNGNYVISRIGPKP